MPGVLPTGIGECCNTDCDTLPPLAVPGPQGDPGADGTNGTDGQNAYTVTTNSFVMPAELANVTIDVENSDWVALNQILFVAVAGATGFFQAVSIPNSVSIQLKNLENTATGAYPVNSAPGTVFAAASKVTGGGCQGPGGAPAAGAFLIANNLSEGTPATMRTNLALGTASTRTAGVANTNLPPVDTTFNSGDALFATASGVQTKVASAARTALGLVIGTNVQAQDATLQSIAALGTAADKIAYTTAIDVWAETGLTAFIRTLLDDVDAATARATLGVNASTLDYMLYRDVQASGVDAGAFTAAAWITVPINTEVSDVGGHGVLAGNQITLAAGTYRYRFAVMAFNAGVFQGRLFNVTDAAVIADGYGTSSICPASCNDISQGFGRFTIASPKAVRLEGFHASATVTFGDASNTGASEYYSFIEFEKE